MSTDSEPIEQEEIDEAFLKEESKRLRRKELRGDREETTSAFSTRFTAHQLEYIEQNVKFGEYEDMSEYVRHKVLDWDMAMSLSRRSGVVIHWLKTKLDRFEPEDLQELADLLQKYGIKEGGRRESEGRSTEEIMEVLDEIEKQLLGVSDEQMEQ